MKRRTFGAIGILLILLAVALTPKTNGAHASPQQTRATATEEDTFWLNWTKGIDLSQSPSDQASWPAWDITADGQTIYIAWSDARDGAQNVYYTRTEDGGNTWNSALPVWQSGQSSVRPTMALWAGQPHIAWAEGKANQPLYHDTYYIKIGAAGPTIVPNSSTYLATVPRMVVDSAGKLHLALQGGGNSQPTDTLYTGKNAWASSWPAAATVAEHQATGTLNPAIAVSASDVLHLAWQESRDEKSDIVYVSRPVGGVAWSSPITLSTGITASVRPALAAGPGNRVYVAWGEKAPDVENQYVRFTRSDNGGASWSKHKRILSYPVSANSVAPTDLAPAIAVTPSGTVCVAWHGFEPSATYEAEEIYVTCSNDGGNTWGQRINISNSPATISIRPILAAGGDGLLHIAWQESTGGDPRFNYQIYYAHTIPCVIHLPLIRRS
jgi:hypothetical protein